MPRSSPTISVLVVDDHRAVAEAIRSTVAQQRGFTATSVTSGEEAIEAVRRRPPDIVLMDVSMPGLGGLEATRRIKELAPDLPVIMLSAFEDDLLKARALEAGAAGYVSKIDPMGAVIEAVRRTHAGKPILDDEEVERLERRLRRRRLQDATERQRANRLSEREIEILQALADGRSSREAASHLGITPNTLRTHMQNVTTKLGVHSKVEAIVVAIRHGKITARS